MKAMILAAILAILVHWITMRFDTMLNTFNKYTTFGMTYVGHKLISHVKCGNLFLTRIFKKLVCLKCKNWIIKS